MNALLAAGTPAAVVIAYTGLIAAVSAGAKALYDFVSGAQDRRQRTRQAGDAETQSRLVLTQGALDSYADRLRDDSDKMAERLAKRDETIDGLRDDLRTAADTVARQALQIETLQNTVARQTSQIARQTGQIEQLTARVSELEHDRG